MNWLKDVKQIEILSYDRMMERQKEVHKLNKLQLLISEVVCLLVRFSIFKFFLNLAVICYFMIEIVDATTFYLAEADDRRIL